MNRKEVRDAVLNYIKDNNYPTLLVLVQGVAGSGKTTFANSLANIIEETRPRLQNEPLPYCPAPYEADLFFEDKFSGEYNYNQDFIEYAHAYCLGDAANALMHGLCAIVSNTFTSPWELDKYYNLAKVADAKVILIRMLTEYGSVHNVPDAVIEKHKSKLTRETKYKPDYIVDEPIDTAEWRCDNM